jgi:hypothetical protein
MHVLGESQPQLIQLAVNDKLSLFIDRIDTVTSAIKQLHDKELALDYLCNDQMLKLYESVNQTAMVGGNTLLPKQVSDLFQIETYYLM